MSLKDAFCSSVQSDGSLGFGGALVAPGRKDHVVARKNRAELVKIVFEVSDSQVEEAARCCCSRPDLRAIDTNYLKYQEEK